MATSTIKAKGLSSVYYNANTAIGTESNRTDAMEYIYQNFVKTGVANAATIRYASGYAAQYIFLGNPGNAYGTGVLELFNNQVNSNYQLNGWVRGYDGSYIKTISILQ